MSGKSGLAWGILVTSNSTARELGRWSPKSTAEPTTTENEAPTETSTTSRYQLARLGRRNRLPVAIPSRRDA